MTHKRCFLLLVPHGCSLKQTLPRKFSSLIILKRWYQSLWVSKNHHIADLLDKALVRVAMDGQEFF
jgi:hypothetical protein